MGVTASIGDRMKRYEAVTDLHFTPNSPVVIRVDGKTFHSFLRNANRPFDDRVMRSMSEAALNTMTNMQGAKLAYTQSDECTFVITDTDKIETEGWFGYSLNKIVSITASMFTGYFNAFFSSYAEPVTTSIGFFDARAFVIPEADVPNVFVWRQRDWERNSVQMLTRANFSHKECHGKKISDMHEMLHSKGINWATDITDAERNGTFITRNGEFVHQKLAYAEIKALIDRKENGEDDHSTGDPSDG